MTRFARIFVKKFWFVCAALLITVAVIVQLGRELSPLLGEYKDELCEYLSGQLGVTVTVDSLNGKWVGLRPALQFSGLRMVAPDNTEVLAVQEGTAKLSLLGSLQAWRLKWKHLSFSDVKIFVQQDEKGQWNPAGLPRTTAVVSQSENSGSSTEFDDPVDLFLFGRLIELHNVRLHLIFRTGHSTELQVPNILLENDNLFHRLKADVNLDTQAGAVSLILEGIGDPRDRETFSAKGFLEISKFPLEKPIAAAASKLWRSLPDGEWRNGQTADVKLWLNSIKGGGFTFQGLLGIDGVPESLAEVMPANMELPQKFRSGAVGQWVPGQRWELAFLDARFHWNDHVSPPLNLIAEYASNKVLQVRADKFVLEQWRSLADQHGFLSGRLADALNTLQPRGTLQNLLLKLDFNEENAQFQLKGNLDQVSVNGYRGAPALENVNGYIQATRDGGFVDVLSEQGFSMHYPEVYHKPMEYQSMKGQIAWHLQPENNAIYINSGPLSLRNSDETVDGFFHIFLPWVKNSVPSNMVLQIGLQDSQAKYHHKYVPFTVSAPLREWLDSSLGTGDIEDGGFIYNGSLAKARKEGRAIQLYLNIRNAVLDYHPGWPGLTEIDGQLTLDDAKVMVEVEKAKLYDSRVGSTLVTVAPNPLGKGSLLSVKGQVTGDARDGLKVLRESQIRQVVGNTFDQWAMKGAIQTELALSIPLEKNSPGNMQQVQVNLSGVSLTMDDLDLPFRKLKGRINYSSAKGLRADNLTGSLWNYPVNLSIKNPKSEHGGRDTIVGLKGRVKPETLAHWSSRPELFFASGVLGYQAELRIPSVDANENYLAYLNVKSDLVGMSVHLPDPYGKTVDQTRSLQVAIPIRKHERLYDIRYGDMAHAQFLELNNQLEKANVALNEESQLPDEHVFLINGAVGKLVLSEWQDVLDQYALFEQKILSYSLNKSRADKRLENFNTDKPVPENKKLDQRFDLAVDNLTVSDLVLEDISVKGYRANDHWALAMENTLLAGDLKWFDSEEKNPVLALQYLRLPAPEEETVLPFSSEEGVVITEKKPVDPLKDWNPSDVIPFDFSTQEFSVGEENYGKWSFNLRQIENGLVAQNLKVTVKGTNILSWSEGDGAEFTWTQNDNKNISRFRGRILAKDLAKVAKEWGQPKLVESELALFDAELSWSGSPTAFAVKKLSGTLYMDIEKGRFFSSGGAGNNPLLRLIGLFNFDTWARRLELDFSDLYKGGMAFDEVSGHMQFVNGVIYLNSPIEVLTPSSSLQMAGTIDVNEEQLDATLVATLPVGGNLTLLTAIAAGLPAAAGVYVASKLFKKQVDKVASASYKMRGPWSEPEVSFERLFDNKAAKRAGEGTKKESKITDQKDALFETDSLPLPSSGEQPVTGGE